MKKPAAAYRLVVSLFITGLLLSFVIKTTSPKIIFMPFLICSLSMAGQCVAQMVDNEKWASVFHKLFVLGFGLFWFGFLIVAAVFCIRDKSYGLLTFTLPFWLVGIFFVRNKLLGRQTTSPISFPAIISTLLTILVLLAGIFLLVLGLRRSTLGLIFAGCFFLLGGFVFVLFGLTMRGAFNKAKIDILGLYFGLVFVAIGFGVVAVKFSQLGSLPETLRSFGLWVAIPALLVIAGVLQIIKSLKGKRV